MDTTFTNWIHRLQMELAPTHGRMRGALRTAGAATLAATVLLHLQMSMLAPGLYLIYLISYDLPYLTFKRAMEELGAQTATVLLALAYVNLTGNDPMARVLGIAAFAWLSAFLQNASTQRVVAMNLGIFSFLTLTLWDMHRPASQLVYLSFATMATGSVAIAIKIALEYLFTRRNPYQDLQREMHARLEAVQCMLASLASVRDAKEHGAKIQAVTRLAFQGQGKMSALLQELQSRPTQPSATGELPISLVPLVARFLDLAASLGRRTSETTAHTLQDEFAILATRLTAFLETRLDPEAHPHIQNLQNDPALQQLEEELDNLVELCRLRKSHPAAEQVLPAPQQRWFRADAWTNPEYKIYATKLSLSLVIAYVLYNAMGWPGISTAALTILIVGLSTTGASNQKLLLRFAGSLIGGVILGLGCQIFIYPQATSALPFLLTFFAVSLLGAWIARSAHLGYVGMQIIFSFYLVAFQTSMMPPAAGGEFAPAHLPVTAFGAPLQMTQGRDRVLGLLLALVVMALVFHRLHPQRAVERMRLRLADLLRIEAQQLQALATNNRQSELQLRIAAAEVVREIRTLAEAIPFEPGSSDQHDEQQAEIIQEALTQAGSTFLHLAALAHSQLPHSLRVTTLQEFRDALQTISSWLTHDDRQSSGHALSAPLAPTIVDASFTGAQQSLRNLQRLCLQMND